MIVDVTVIFAIRDNQNYELFETVFWTVIWTAVRGPGGECVCVLGWGGGHDMWLWNRVMNDGNKKV